MNFFGEIETVIEAITNNTSAFEGTLQLLDGVISGLQQVLNAPNQHELLQKAVNTLSQKKGELASAVVANTAPPPPNVSNTGQAARGE